MNTTFDDYLAKKKIDANTFRADNPDLYWRFSAIFDCVHEDSFTAQKLYWINKLRRMYLAKN